MSLASSTVQRSPSVWVTCFMMASSWAWLCWPSPVTVLVTTDISEMSVLAVDFLGAGGGAGLAGCSSGPRAGRSLSALGDCWL